MKHFLLLFFIVFTVGQIRAQESYTPLRKANKSTDAIVLNNADEINAFLQKTKKYENCYRLKIDLILCSKVEISLLLKKLKELNQIQSLEIVYRNDSLNYADLQDFNSLQSLLLKNLDMQYNGIEQLQSLRQLNTLSLYLSNLNAFPPAALNFDMLYEIVLYHDTFLPLLYTDICLHKPDSTRTDNKLFISSQVEGIDLNLDSLKYYLLSLGDGYTEYEASSVFTQTKRKVNTGRSLPLTYPNLPQFKPLFPKANPSGETALIDNRVNNRLLFDDNTELQIPADAFQTKSGVAYSGDVSIYYRSIRCMADILESGITMTYDSAGETNLFKSNGMFEIRANSGKEDLELKPGKSIGMSYVPNADSGAYNLYSMSDTTGQWKFTTSLSFFRNASNTQFFYYMKDQTDFQTRYESLNYFYLFPSEVKKGDIYTPKLSNARSRANDLIILHGKYRSNRRSNAFLSFNIFSREKTFNKIRKNKNLVKLNTKNTYNHLNERVLCFNITEYYNNGSKTITAELFPELQFFFNYDFVLDEKMSSSEFSKKYKQRKYYSDLRIYYEYGASTAIVELKTETGYTEIPVNVLLRLSNGKEKVNPRFLRAYRKYCYLLGIKENKFNKACFVAYPSYASDSFIYKTNEIRVNSGNNLRRYQFDITVLGFFNCDQLYRMKKPMMVNAAKFITGEGKAIHAGVVYVVDSLAKGTYTFAPENFIFCSNGTSGLIVRDDENMMYTCKGVELNKLMKGNTNNSGITITLMEVPFIDTAEAALKELR